MARGRRCVGICGGRREGDVDDVRVGGAAGAELHVHACR